MEISKTMLFALPNVEQLGKNISECLKIPLNKIDWTRFADGEIILQSVETVRNKHVFVVASCSAPVNDNIMQLLLFIDSLKRASAKTITIALAYYGYARQDRKASGRQPIGAKLVADLLEKAGATKIITVDLHNPSIQGFFNIPVDDLKGQYIFARHIKALGKFTVVSPDHGGAVRARTLAELISNTVDIAIVDKRRTGTNVSETLGVLGDVSGQNVVILDDIIDTGGTIVKAAKALKEKGAKSIVIAATHGLFSRGFDVFENAEYIDKVLVSDTVPASSLIKSPKLLIISVAELISSSIFATADSQSITQHYASIKNNL